MPQASSEQQAEWGIDDGPVIKFLEAAGYRMTRTFFWVLPTPDHVPTEKEYSAIDFLIDEWDFGGIVKAGSRFYR